MLQLHFVAVNFLTAELTIDFMEVDAVVATEKRAYFQKVGTELIDIAGFAGIVAVYLDTAGEVTARFESGNVVGLPAVQ